MAKLTIFFDSWGHWPRSQSQTIETARSCLYDMNRVEEINLNGFSSEKLEDIFRDMPKLRLNFIPCVLIKGLMIFHFLKISSTTQNAYNVLSCLTVRSVGTLSS